jgi:hypothetical protein
METFYSIASLLIQIALGFAPIFIVKAALETKAGIGRVVRGASKVGDSMTGKARQRAQSSSFYQKKELTRQARANELRRGGIASYSELMSGKGLGSTMARRRAAGGIGSQLLNTNQAGQERIRLNAIAQLEKQEHEEVQQATQLLDHNRITTPADFAAIARGGEGKDVTGKVVVSGAGNTPMRQAAIQKLVDAEDAEQLEGLFRDLTSAEDQTMLVNLLRKGSNYSKAKSAGAHLVAMGPQAGGYSSDDVQDQAIKALGKLSAEKLASQDGPAIQSAVAALASGRASVSLDERRAFYDKVQEVYSNAQMYSKAKGSALSGLPINPRTGAGPGMNALFTRDPNTGAVTPNMPRP